MWSWKKCSLVSLRAGLFIAVMFSAFWYIWSIYAPVPELSTIELMPGNVLTLPFYLSRWSDVVVATLLVAMMLTCYGRMERKHELWFGVVVGFLFGIVITLICGQIIERIISLGYGLGDVLGFELIFGLLVVPVFGLIVFNFGLVFGLSFGLGYVLAVGLVYGLVVGLIYGLTVGLIIGLIYGLVLLVIRAKPFFAYITGSKLS